MAKTKKDKNQKPYTYAVGRRKTANARVRLYSKKTVPGSKHQIIVNQQNAFDYFPGELNKIKLMKPFELTDTKDKFSISAKVQGSGKSGQLDAVVHGISRTISKFDKDKYRTILKKAGMLTRDPQKERRKPGTGGKARRKRQSPKR